jgi:hypothetical protein
VLGPTDTQREKASEDPNHHPATCVALAILDSQRRRVVNMRNDCDEAKAAYYHLVACARASERITPEGLEQVYAMPISVSDTEIARLIAAGELEPGTLRPLRSDFAMEPSPKQAIGD